MPIRKIKIPPPLDIQFVDRPMEFSHFVELLFNNPLWNEGYKRAIAQATIAKALKTALESGEKTLLLAEEDWTLLKQAVESPKTAVGVNQVEIGYGTNPSAVRHLVPFMEAILDAERDG